MRSLITLSISLFIGSVISLKNSDSADELGDSFQPLNWKDSSTKNTFKIKTKSNIRLQVVDYKNAGDVFEVFDNGVSLGKTSIPADAKINKIEFALTPEEALEKEGFSKGTFDLLAGNHKITIKAINPYSERTAAVRLLGGEEQVSTHLVKRGGHKHRDEDKEYDADDEGDDENEEEDDKEHGHGHGHEKWDKKHKYHNVEEEGYDDDDWNEGNSGHDDHEDHPITLVDTAHTRRVVRTVYVDSPEHSYSYIELNNAMTDEHLNRDLDRIKHGRNYQSVVALDTW